MRFDVRAIRSRFPSFMLSANVIRRAAERSQFLLSSKSGAPRNAPPPAVGRRVTGSSGVDLLTGGRSADLDAPRPGLLGDRDPDRQYAGLVVGLEAIAVEAVT